MKKIKTDNYVKKQAQFGDLPGDPSLPPGITNNMIDEQFGDATDLIEKTAKDTFELERNWDEYAAWYRPERHEVLPSGSALIYVTARYKVEGVAPDLDIDLVVQSIVDGVGRDISQYEIHDQEAEEIKGQIRETVGEEAQYKETY